MNTFSMLFIRSMTEGYVFTAVCLFGGGGVPQSMVPCPFLGYPCLWFHVPSGGRGLGYIMVGTGASPWLEHRLDMGTPLDWGTPLHSWDWVPLAGTGLPPPPQDWLCQGRYAFCGFRQENFLILCLFWSKKSMSQHMQQPSS